MTLIGDFDTEQIFYFIFLSLNILKKEFILPWVGLWNGILWWVQGHPGGHKAAYLPANAPQREMKPNLQKFTPARKKNVLINLSQKKVEINHKSVNARASVISVIEHNLQVVKWIRFLVYICLKVFSIHLPAIEVINHFILMNFPWRKYFSRIHRNSGIYGCECMRTRGMVTL